MNRKRKPPVIELSSDEELSPPRPRNKRRAKVSADLRPPLAVHQFAHVKLSLLLRCEDSFVVQAGAFDISSLSLVLETCQCLRRQRRNAEASCSCACRRRQTLLTKAGFCRARSRQARSASAASCRCKSRSRRHFSARQKFRSTHRFGR